MGEKGFICLILSVRSPSLRESGPEFKQKLETEAIGEHCWLPLSEGS